MTAYLLMALLCGAAMLWLVRPWLFPDLWRKPDAAAVERRAANIAAYKSRLGELDNEVAAGLLTPESAESLRQEAQTRLLGDAQPTEAQAADRPSRLWLAALALPLFAALWYGLADSWRTQDLIDLARKDPSAAQQLSVEAMLSRLENRLREQPDDAEGWAMLGRSYMVLQRHAESAGAYEKANGLSDSKNPDWLVGQGEALALSRDRDLQGRPAQLFEAALTLAPENIGALWYAGLAAAQAEDYARTQEHWGRLSALELPQDLREALAPRLAELEKLTGKPLPSAAAAAPALRLTVAVSLAPELAAELSPEHSLFVFAKAAEGPPMPLAVQKLQAVSLPLSVTLDDSMGMMPNLKLSQFQTWVVTARLTRSGGVKAGPGDLEGSITVSATEAGKPLPLLISQRLK